MQTPLQQVDFNELKRSLGEEWKRLKALAEEIERTLEAAGASDTIEKARRSQNDSNWLRELREQYNEEVCASTLEANRLFPVVE